MPGGWKRWGELYGSGGAEGYWKVVQGGGLLDNVINEWLGAHANDALSNRVLTLTHLDHLAHYHAEHMVVHGTGHDSKPKVLVLLEEAAEALRGAFDEHMRSEDW